MNEGPVLGVEDRGHVGEDTHQFCLLVEMLVSFFKNIYLFIWLCWVLLQHAGHLIFVVACSLLVIACGI